jgi:hypothetical protein
LQSSFEKWEMFCEASYVLREVEDQLKACNGVSRRTMADKVIGHFMKMFDHKLRAPSLSSSLMYQVTKCSP